MPTVEETPTPSSEGPEIKVNKIKSPEEIARLLAASRERGFGAISTLFEHAETGMAFVHDHLGGVRGPAKFASELTKAQLRKDADFTNAIGEGKLALTMLSSPHVQMAQFFDMAANPVPSNVSKLYGVPINTAEGVGTIAVGQIEGKDYLLYAKGNPLRIVRGEEGFDSIEGVGRAVIGISGKNTCVIDPITGKRTAEIGIKLV